MYAKARDVFAEYKVSGYNQEFLEKYSVLLLPLRVAREAINSKVGRILLE